MLIEQIIELKLKGPGPLVEHVLLKLVIFFFFFIARFFVRVAGAAARD